MTHKAILTGHYQVIPPYLASYVESETPNCLGKAHIRYCFYSGVECTKKCPEPFSVNCSEFHRLRKFHNIEDKFGVVRR